MYSTGGHSPQIPSLQQNGSQSESSPQGGWVVGPFVVDVVGGGVVEVVVVVVVVDVVGGGVVDVVVVVVVVVVVQGPELPYGPGLPPQ